LQRLAVNRRIFPAGVIDERSGIDRVEYVLVDAIAERELCLQSLFLVRMAASAAEFAQTLWGGCDARVIN
jgi:hypothetical protein